MEIIIDKSARGTKRGRASRVISSDDELLEVAIAKRSRASRLVADEEGANDDGGAVDIEGDAGESTSTVQSSWVPGMGRRTSSSRVRQPPARAVATSNSPFSDDNASACRPDASPPPSPKPATKSKSTRKKAPPKRRPKKETESESEFDDPDVVMEDDLSDNVPVSSIAISKSKGRRPTPSGKGRGGATKKKASEPVVVARDESSGGKKASTSAVPPAKRPRAEEIATSSPLEQAAAPEPPVKKSKLPPIPRKSNIGSITNGTASAGSNTPTSKPNTGATPVLSASVRRPPPVSGVKKGGDIDLNNLDEYNKLFGIATGSSVCLFECDAYVRLT